MKSSTRTIWQWVFGLFFIGAGANHFIVPAPYISMMPQWLPWPVALVQWSGVAEIMGGVGLLVPRCRRVAAWGLIWLLVAVFPANLNVAINGWPGVDLPAWALWIRLPFQAVLIGCLYRIYLFKPNSSS